MLDSKIFTFLKVVQLRSYTNAAKELHLTQPAITQHIRKLEEYYKCRLIDIKGKSVNLTTEGKALYDYAKLQLINEEQLINRIKSIVSPIRIGATLSIADYYLPSYLASYMSHKENSFSVTVKNTKSLINMLLNGQLDCAFIEGIFDKTIFESYEFCKARFLPVGRKGHPLEGKTSSLRRFHEFPLILREKGSGTRNILENYLYQENDSILSFSKTFEISSFGIIKQLLLDSDAISFMYEEVARREVEDGKLSYLSLENFSIQRSLYFISPLNSVLEKKYKNFYKDIVIKYKE